MSEVRPVDGIKLMALLLLSGVLAFALGQGDMGYQRGDMPRVYLNVDKIHADEEPASLTFMGNDTMRDVGALVRQRGNTNMTAEKMSFNIRFMRNARLFGMDANDRWILLGVPFDKALIRTELGFGYARAIGLEGISQTMFCDVYLGGDYHGLYILCEPVTARGLGLDLGAGDFLLEKNMNRTVEGKTYLVTQEGLRFELTADASAQQCADVLNRAERAMVSGVMEEYERYIDVDSFVNAYIAQEVVKNVDFSWFSDRYYVKDGRLFAGPLWDMDLSMGNVSDLVENEVYDAYNNLRGAGDGSGDSARGLWAQRDWFAYLCADDAFMQRVTARWQEVYPITENLIRDNELGMNRIDELITRCRSSIDQNYARWDVSTRYSAWELRERFDTYDAAAEHLKSWLTRRIDWLSAAFAGHDREMEE